MAPWGNYYRLLIVFVGFLCLTSVCSNYIVINFTLICMKTDMSDGVTINNNGTAQSIYDYTVMEKKLIMWSVAAGTFLGTIPINLLYVKYGARWPFLISGLVSALVTALIPWSAKFHFYALLLLRFVQGVAYSADFAAIGLMTVRWSPLSESATFVAILTSFTGISSIITNSISGVICEMDNYGWKWSYYFHAVLGIVLFLIWFIVYIDDPQETKRVSQRELAKITKNKSAAHLNKKTPVPYRKVLTSPVVLVVWLNAFFELTAVIFFSTYAPIYFYQVLKFSVTETGFYVALVLGSYVPIRGFAALASDKLKSFSEKTKIYFFNTIAVGVSGTFFAIIGFFGVDQRYYAIAASLGCMICVGVNSGGFYKCGVLHTRQFAHVVIAAIQWMKCLALFAAPAIVAIFVTNDSNQAEWFWVFITIGGSMIVINFISYLVFTDEPAEWTDTHVEKPPANKCIDIGMNKC